MQQEPDFFDNLYTSYERAFVLQDGSWLTPSAWMVAVLLVLALVWFDQVAERWQDRKITDMKPPLTAQQMVDAKRWFGAGRWAFYLLILAAYILAWNWP